MTTDQDNDGQPALWGPTPDFRGLNHQRTPAVPTPAVAPRPSTRPTTAAPTKAPTTASASAHLAAAQSVPVRLPTRRPTAPMEYSELWNIDQVSTYLGIPKDTVYGWRKTNYGPQGFRVGKHLRWRAATVIAWTLELERGQ